MERIILKKKKLQCYFISNPGSAFYETGLFNKILTNVSKHHSGFTLKQSNTQLILIHEKVSDFSQAMGLLESLAAES